MGNLNAAFRAGRVMRWHTNPDLAHTNDRIDGHAGRVARIILMLHPSPSLALIRAALIHDDGESVVGDVSATFKASMPGMMRAELAMQEGAYVTEIWGDHDDLSGEERKWLRFADRLDAYMWAAHHAPHVMGRDGWPEAWEWLWAEAGNLNCLDPIDEIITEASHGTA